MLIVMRPDATTQDIERVDEEITRRGWQPHAIPGGTRTAIGITGNKGAVEPEPFRVLPGVADAVAISQPFKLVSREVKKEDTAIDVDGVPLGGPGIQLMAGPCSVETEEQILETARAVARSGARFLRGGAFKPRTSPYEFQGLREDGLKLLALARQETGLKIVTEVKDTATLDQVAQVADVLQIGARNMQNFSLLSEVWKVQRPVLLKRGLSATIKELLMAAEYVMAQGNRDVILCERGIRTYETATRNTFDVAAIPVLKKETHLPVVVDPSHAGGRADLVAPLAFAAIAAGADGLIIEVHPTPESALSDGDQSLTLDAFADLMRRIAPFAHAAGRELAPPSAAEAAAA
jgi:3-deoxy-7-phosphoheptulonate synthase